MIIIKLLLLSNVLTFGIISFGNTYQPKFNIDNLILLLESSEEDFENQLNKIDTGWKRVSNLKNPGRTYSNGALIISKPSDRELVFIDQSKTNHKFLNYIRSLNSKPTKENDFYYFNYKEKYLIYYTDKLSPVSILVNKVY